MKKQIENIKNEIQSKLKTQYNIDITISEKKIETFNGMVLSDIYPAFFKIYNISIPQNMDLKKFKIEKTLEKLETEENINIFRFFITMLVKDELTSDESKTCKKIIDNFESLFYNIEKNLNIILGEFKEIENLTYPNFRGTSIINKLIETISANGYVLKYGIDYNIYPKNENTKKMELLYGDDKIGISYYSNKLEESITLTFNDESVKILKDFEISETDEDISKLVYFEVEEIIRVKCWVR